MIRSLHNSWIRRRFIPSFCFAFNVAICFIGARRTHQAFARVSSASFPYLLRTSAQFSTKQVEPRGDKEIMSNLDPLEFYHALRACKDQYICGHLNKALDTLSDAVRLFGPKYVFSSYNGGKDADVIMHLLRAIYAKYSHDTGSTCIPDLVYFENDDEFPEVIEHIENSKKLFDLNIVAYKTGIVQGLREHIESSKSPAHCAFVLGTRKGDPNCGEQETFAPSSSWMPLPFMRVNPILHWEFGHVWHFLRLFSLPYCSLYDDGYTSLGKRSLTLPNPALLRKDLCGISQHSPSPLNTLPRYWPAYMLSDWSLERAGRVKKEDLRPTAMAQNAECSATSESASSDPSLNDLKPASSTSDKKTQSAALVIIGDEILNGFTAETNLMTTARALTSIGIPLRMVSVVSDEVDTIAAEVLRMSQRYDLVITSGGIGPTHDDVTLKAIAQALRQEMRVSPEMMNHLEDIAGGVEHLDEGMKRLAMLPEQSKLRFPPAPDDFTTKVSLNTNNVQVETRNKTWPILQCDNIFVLPGVPQFFSAKMMLMTKHFLKQHAVFETRKIVLDIEERSVVQQLDCLVERFPEVKIGSYPFVDHPEFKTIITLTAETVEQVEEAVAGLLEVLPRHAVLRVEKGVHNSNSDANNISN